MNQYELFSKLSKIAAVFGVSDIDDETIKNKLKGLLLVDFTNLSGFQRENIKYLTLAQKLYEKDNC